MKNCTIKNEFYTITVSTKGAELISVKGADGYEYIWQQTADNLWDGHAPILFPVCGRLLGQRYTYKGKEYLMDLHGFAKDFDFAVASKEGSHITLTLSSSAQTKEIFPFDFTLVANYELRGKDIIFTFTVANKSEEAMPYMFGWHPGFSLPCESGVDIESYKLDLGVNEIDWIPLQNGPFACPKSQKYALEGGVYPLCEEEIYKKDTMIFKGHLNRLEMTADGSSYKLSLEWSENMPYLCIWKDEFNEAKFICLEPWSDLPADGVTPENFDERKMQRMPKGESETYTVKFSFEK
ncbi:MAG: hypothetical protein E7612_10675 [Ruminococcaceae bacterium]|nr:hypothetical protein [Oscillospiraceae bacterium]